MGNLGWNEILLILVFALIIFGPRKLPELGKSLGKGLAQFRRASDDFKRTWEDEVEMEKRRPTAYFPEPPEPPSSGSETGTYQADSSSTSSPETTEPDAKTVGESAPKIEPA
jgi:TatA/E family protein of Tat protein translocase